MGKIPANEILNYGIYTNWVCLFGGLTLLCIATITYFFIKKNMEDLYTKKLDGVVALFGITGIFGIGFTIRAIHELIMIFTAPTWYVIEAMK